MAVKIITSSQIQRRGASNPSSAVGVGGLVKPYVPAPLNPASLYGDAQRSNERLRNTQLAAFKTKSEAKQRTWNALTNALDTAADVKRSMDDKAYKRALIKADYDMINDHSATMDIIKGMDEPSRMSTEYVDRRTKSIQDYATKNFQDEEKREFWVETAMLKMAKENLRVQDLAWDKEVDQEIASTQNRIIELTDRAILSTDTSEYRDLVEVIRDDIQSLEDNDYITEQERIQMTQVATAKYVGGLLDSIEDPAEKIIALDELAGHRDSNGERVLRENLYKVERQKAEKELLYVASSDQADAWFNKSLIDNDNDIDQAYAETLEAASKMPMGTENQRAGKDIAIARVQEVYRLAKAEREFATADLLTDYLAAGKDPKTLTPRQVVNMGTKAYNMLEDNYNKIHGIPSRSIVEVNEIRHAEVLDQVQILRQRAKDGAKVGDKASVAAYGKYINENYDVLEGKLKQYRTLQDEFLALREGDFSLSDGADRKIKTYSEFNKRLGDIKDLPVTARRNLQAKYEALESMPDWDTMSPAQQREMMDREIFDEYTENKNWRDYVPFVEYEGERDYTLEEGGAAKKAKQEIGEQSGEYTAPGSRPNLESDEGFWKRRYDELLEDDEGAMNMGVIQSIFAKKNINPTAEQLVRSYMSNFK